MYANTPLDKCFLSFQQKRIARIQCRKYRVAPDMAMTGLRIMILLYGAGGELAEVKFL